eukprot:EC824984.1.p1 GENE.EC824984.1~~EC824984.1.p1  ORF type:complete len:121 (+),score=65.66 EC824984.1:27-389(+)
MMKAFSTTFMALKDRVKNKVCLVTGGASGLGEASCIRLHEEGAKIVIADLNEKLGNALAEKLNKKAANSAIFVKLDVTKEESWANVMKVVAQKFKRLDGLVNSAGITSTWNVEQRIKKRI